MVGVSLYRLFRIITISETMLLGHNLPVRRWRKQSHVNERQKNHQELVDGAENVPIKSVEASIRAQVRRQLDVGGRPP
jgi:hypothetical protein